MRFALNPGELRAETLSVEAQQLTDVRPIASGDILVSPRGTVRIVRSRTAADDGWNCTDGAPLPDVEACDPQRWKPYTPDELAIALELAEQVKAISDQPVVQGGLRTWDACSGRPCVLPKLANVARQCQH